MDRSSTTSSTWTSSNEIELGAIPNAVTIPNSGMLDTTATSQRIDFFVSFDDF
jgi:hypothetical protein